MEAAKLTLRRDLIAFAFQHGGVVDTRIAARKLRVSRNLATRTMKALVEQGYFSLKDELYVVVK